MRRYKGHRMKEDEMEEQFSKEARTEVCRRRSENHRRKCWHNLGAVVGTEEGVVESILGNEGRIDHAWVNVRGGMRVFSVYFRHSEGWTPRNEALLEAVAKQVEATRHPWLTACDANVRSEDIEKSMWFQRGADDY